MCWRSGPCAISNESGERVRGFRSVSVWAPKAENGQRAVSDALSADEEELGGLFWFGVKAVRVPSLFLLHAGRFWGTPSGGNYSVRVLRACAPRACTDEPCMCECVVCMCATVWAMCHCVPGQPSP